MSGARSRLNRQRERCAGMAEAVIRSVGAAAAFSPKKETSALEPKGVR